MSGIKVTTPSDTEIRTSRTFDAPRELVFAAHTQAEHVKHWWGRGNPLDVEIDFRVGGRYRFVEHAEGREHGFRGEFREIAAPERMVQTFEWEGMPGHIAVDSYVFTEHDGRTTVTVTSRYDTTEDRDGMLSPGMEDGAEQSYLALDKYLANLA
jgi:uncharacterized protein YndB with AHSA1/START domain